MPYQIFTAVRATEPDPTTLLAGLRALDASAGVQHAPGTTEYTIKKATAWTAPQITAAQNVLNTSAASTPELTSQAVILNWPIETRALVLALIDQLNVIRAALPVPLGAITPAAALAAVSAKAGTL